jgi:hypothetical protein
VGLGVTLSAEWGRIAMALLPEQTLLPALTRRLQLVLAAPLHNISLACFLTIISSAELFVVPTTNGQRTNYNFRDWIPAADAMIVFMMFSCRVSNHSRYLVNWYMLILYALKESMSHHMIF